LTCGQKFTLYAALYIGVFRYDHSQQGLQHVPSLHRTLSREDSEEIRKGINAVLNDRLNGYDNGFGFGSSMQCAPVNPLGRVCAVRPAGPRRGFGPNAEFNKEILFLFQIRFINYKSI
jgi:hypothetical protein